MVFGGATVGYKSGGRSIGLGFLEGSQAQRVLALL
ncbi:hypothetical protein AMD24_00825 [Candidatus Xiphinematobacter sp. Idaho Grape]|nr:hypothetical protein AMD24_00825 [Candidatus Xiphinematobacter sp. Idaho Grape]